MTISRRLTLWFGGILLVSLAILAGILHYEWLEQVQRIQEQKQDPEPVWEEVGEIILFYGTPTALLLLAGGAWLIRKSLTPIATLTRAIERIHVHNLRERLPQSGNGDELDRLTEVFNSLVARLDRSFSQMRDFTMHASHELKTPLTILRGQIDTRMREPNTTSGDREFLADLLEEIDRLTRIVGSLGLLAKADAGQLAVAMDLVPLDELVRDCFVDAQLLGRSNRIQVQLRTCEHLTVRGDRSRLRQLLLNCVENAINYNQPAGEVTIALCRDNGSAALTITNTGPGIPADKLARVFERFYRGDTAHSKTVNGCGLGLSIAESIVKAHQGTIDLASEPDKLTTLTVRLPAVAVERVDA